MTPGEESDHEDRRNPYRPDSAPAWGDHDPVGTAEVARETARLIPRAQLQFVPAGHAPYLGHPQRVSESLSAFVRSSMNRGRRVVQIEIEHRFGVSVYEGFDFITEPANWPRILAAVRPPRA